MLDNSLVRSLAELVADVLADERLRNDGGPVAPNASEELELARNTVRAELARLIAVKLRLAPGGAQDYFGVRADLVPAAMMPNLDALAVDGTMDIRLGEAAMGAFCMARQEGVAIEPEAMAATCSPISRAW